MYDRLYFPPKSVWFSPQKFIVFIIPWTFFKRKYAGRSVFRRYGSACFFDGSVQDQSAGDVDGLAGHIVGKGRRQIQEHVGNVLRRLGTLQGDRGDPFLPISVRIAASLGDIIQQPIPDVGMDDTGADTVDIDIVGDI